MTKQSPQSQEDRIADAILDRYRERIERGRSEDGSAELEVHYNDYGSRGVVDLVITEVDGGFVPEIRIYELKSEYAVKQSTGANEIIRQFNRHKQSFFSGSNHEKGDYKNIMYFLDFYATDYNYEHIRANEGLYNTVTETMGGIYGEKSGVRLVHPEDYTVGFPLQHLDDEYDQNWNGEREFAEILDSVGDSE